MKDEVVALQQRRNYNFVLMFSIIGATVSTGYALAHLILDRNFLIGIVQLMMALLSIFNAIILIRIKNTALASSVVLIVLCVVLINLITFGGLDVVGIIWFSTFPILAYWMKNTVEATWWIVAIILIICLHTILSTLGMIPGVYNVSQITQLLFCIMTLSVLSGIGKLHTEQDEINLLKSMSELESAHIELLDKTQNERKLKNELIRFKLAVDNAYDFIVITDIDGTVLYANKSVMRVTGFTPEEAIGKKAGVLWGKQMDNDYYRKFWKTIKDEERQFVGEFTNRRKDGSNYVALATVTPVKDTDGILKFYLGIERDVTSEKELEKNKSEFLSFVAHQLRTPVTAIKWNTQLLTDGSFGTLQNSQKEVLNKILHTSSQMVKFIGEFLDVSRVESNRITVNPEKVNLLLSIQEAICEVEPLAIAKNQKIINLIDDQTLEIVVDGELFNQIIMNYLTNAVKYTPENGAITISVKVDDGITVLVRDSGIGISLHEQQYIFSKFFRTELAKSNEVNGTGLGLYFVKEIANLVGSRVGFESVINEGSTFYITIPKQGWRKS